MQTYQFTHVDGRNAYGPGTFDALAEAIGRLQAHEVFAERAYMSEWAISLEEDYARVAWLYDADGELIGTFRDLI
jgi:hypothetical protein